MTVDDRTQGMIKVLDYDPGQINVREFKPHRSFVTALLQLSEIVPCVNRFDLGPLNLGTEDFVEAMVTSDYIDKIRETYNLLLTKLHSGIVTPKEFNNDSGFRVGMYIHRYQMYDKTEVNIETDRFLMLIHVSEEAIYAYALPIFFKVARFGGRNPYEVRKPYFRLSGGEVIFSYRMLKGESKLSPIRFSQTPHNPISLISAMNACIDIQFKRKYEYPIAAATFLGDKVFYGDRPLRHHHVVQSREYHEHKAHHDEERSVQGFLTNHGNFVHRARAADMALMNRCMLDPISYNTDVQVERFPVDIDTLERPQFVQRFTGILQRRDLGPQGVSQAKLQLFSEDIF